MTIERSGTMREAQAGDIVFHGGGTDIVGRMIRRAERIRFKKGSKYSHVSILNDRHNGVWTLYQATGRGVTDTGTLSGEYHIYGLPPGCDRNRVLQFAAGQVGLKYGYLTILSIFVTLFSPGFINVMLPNTWICSAYGGEALRFGGWLKNWPDIYQVSPASLWEALPEIEETL